MPLFRAWESRLAPDEWVLDGDPGGDPGLLLTGTPAGEVVCRSAATGAARWRRRLPLAPRWAASFAGAVLVAGEAGAAAVRAADGTPLWGVTSAEPLSAFRLAGGRLFFLRGDRRLFALDAGSGRVLWDRWAPDGALRLPFPRGCFSSCYHAGPDTVLVQSSTRRQLLDAATGHLLCQAADGRDLWKRPPLPLDGRALCVVPDDRRVVLLDARTGKELWVHTRGEGTTLSGEVSSVLGRGDVLLHLRPGNVGSFLQRLDRATGKTLWPRPPLLTARRIDAGAWDVDAEAVYGVEDRGLFARALSDGRLLWRRPLEPAGDWRARRVGDYLAVYRGAAAPEVQLRYRSPLGELQWNWTSPTLPERVFALSYLDPKTGELVQRLNFRLTAPARTARESRRIPEEGGRSLAFHTSCLLAGAGGPVVRLASPHPVVAAGGDVWGLTSAGY